MEQGLIDIRDRAISIKKKHGKLKPYMISCDTLIRILDELEAAQQPRAVDCALCHCSTVIIRDGTHCVNCGRVYQSHSH